MQAYCVYVPCVFVALLFLYVCVLCWCERLTPLAFAAAAAVIVVHSRGTRADSSNIYIQK